MSNHPDLYEYSSRLYLGNHLDLYYNSSIYPYYEYLIFNNLIKYILYYLWINLSFFLSF